MYIAKSASGTTSGEDGIRFTKAGLYLQDQAVAGLKDKTTV